MDWLWFFYLFQSCYRLGLTSEPVTTGSYSSRRMTAKLNAALRLQLCSSSSSCSPGQADFEKKSQICLLGKLQPHQWSHLDWRLLNSSVNQVSCPCLLLGYAKLATSAQSVQWQLPWIKELHYFFLLFLTYSAQARHKNWLQRHRRYVSSPYAQWKQFKFSSDYKRISHGFMFTINNVFVERYIALKIIMCNNCCILGFFSGGWASKKRNIAIFFGNVLLLTAY